ncbi:low temperature requirement protein A [Peribacillus frigoritolerans]|nr:low temperature requirement protein A [Peribacillus frigoritolerans]
MTSSLSADFDPYYLSFFNWLYWFKSRDCHPISRCTADRRGISKKGSTLFWEGIFGLESPFHYSPSFFDSWLRYAVLYLGILVDIIVPILGRKCLEKVPTNTAHLLERFGLFTIILFGEALVSTLAVIQPKQGNWDSIAFSIISFALIIAMWWQYFDNMDKKVDKSVQSSGQIIIYGHLFILMSISMIAAAIRLLFLHEVHYSFILYFVFGSVLLYFMSATFVFHQYRHRHQRLQIYHLGLFLGILAVFFYF